MRHHSGGFVSGDDDEQVGMQESVEDGELPQGLLGRDLQEVL